MDVLKSIFRFYINSSIHVSFGVVALTAFTCFRHQMLMDYTLLAFIFLCSITGYNFVKYAPVAKLHHRSLTRQLKQIQVFSMVVSLSLLMCLYFLNLKVILISFSLGLITILYAIPIGRKNLREVAFLKVFIIGLIWAVTTYILPFVDSSFECDDLKNLINFEFIERLLWVVLLMIPFEIRDLRFDRKYLKTLVSTFGIWPAKICSFLLLILLFSHKIWYINTDFVWGYACIYMSLAIAILFAKSVQRPYYSSFYVEALPIFWLILIGI